MFTKLPKKHRYDERGRRITSSAKSIAGRLYEQAMENTYVTQARMPEYRPSSFPLCGILIFLKLIKGSSIGRFEEERDASSGFFCSVGTVAHENIQFHIGFSKQIFGDWKCKNIYGCKEAQYKYEEPTVVNSTDNICPSCGQPMEYVEKEIVFNGLKGHIDCIIKMVDGKYWVVDYKTTTKYKMANEPLPKKSHVKQLMTYCYVLAKKYKLKIEGFSVLYFSRDNPFEFKECAFHWDSDWETKSRQLIKVEKVKYVDGVEAFKTLDTTNITKCKQCKSRKYYDKEVAYYNDCPLLDVCFDKRKLKEFLVNYIKEFPTQKQDRLKLTRQIYNRMNE